MEEQTMKKEYNMALAKKKAEHLTQIYILMGKHVFGYRMAATIVGGRARLDKLIGEGCVQAEKRSSAQNGKVYCNAAQVLYYAKIAV